MGSVLKGGFEMANLHYTEPTSILSALQLIGDVTLPSSAQQFGGYTIAEIDKLLVPYAKKTIKTLEDTAKEFGVIDVKKYVEQGLRKELMQGFQSLEMKLVMTIRCVTFIWVKLRIIIHSW